MPINPRRPERRRDPGWIKPFALALGMHGLLFALLALGVAWHTEEPAAVQAELWSETIRESGAAPKAETPAEPAPEETRPVPREEVVVPPTPPQPTPQPVPPPRPVPPPPAPVVPPAPTKADIALERQRAAAQAQKEAEQAAERKRIEQQKLDDARQRDLAERKRQDQLKADQLKADQQRKAEDDRKRQADATAAKAKADADAKAKADADAKAKADAAAKAKADAAEKAKADAAAKAAAQQRFDKDLARMSAMAGGSGASGPTSATGGNGSGQSGTGRDAVSSGPRGDGGYAGRVAQKIRSNTVFDVPDSLSGNPPVVYHVTLDPTGDVLDLRKTQSSGVPGFDEAVERAIRKSAPFPPDASGRPPREFDVSHRPKDR